MELPRRAFLHLATAASALPAASRLAWADTYPARPVRMLVGYTAGSAPDILARIMGQWLSDRLGQPFVVENRPGAGTNLAAEAVVRAPADGYTLLVITVPGMLSGLLYSNLPYDFTRDVAPIASVVGSPFFMLVNPAVPAKTVSEFIAYAKANPGKLNMASQGTGTLTHLAGELFKMMAGVDMLHVPYHGEMEALTDMLSGRAQVMFDPVATSLPHVKAGKLRALAVTTAKRIEQMPDLPTVAESLPGYDVEGFLGLGAPAGTPDDVVDKINGTVNAGLADATVKAKYVGIGAIPEPMNPQDYRKLIAGVIDKLGGAIKFAGIRPA